jgi:cytosine/adenosine deaminase-related metal-dependent hydrolase
MALRLKPAKIACLVSVLCVLAGGSGSVPGCGGSSLGNDDTGDGGSGEGDAFDGGGIEPAEAGADSRASVDGALPTEGGADAGPAPTIMLGAKDRFLLIGTVVTPDVTIDGAVLIEQDKITCVDLVGVCAGMPNAPGATIIDTKGIIAPGLIDTHNHILFDIFNDDDWLPAQLYQDHNQWPNEPKYQAMLDVKQCLADDSQGKPAWCAQTPYGTAAGSLRCEMDKWGELKGIVAGTTSIVGLPGISSACFGSLARSIDVSQNGLGQDKMQTSATFPPSNPDGVCANFASGTTDAFLVHVGEGTDLKALNEWATLGSVSTTPGCLYAAQTTITHGVAFGANELRQMGTAGMRLTWSPHSNVSLYGATADVPLAIDSGVEVALAPDWSMGGSQNMLEELRFARDWDKGHFGATLTAKDLVRMATLTPAKVLAIPSLIGKLAPGMLADVAVFSGDRAAPYDAIVNATPTNVRLVMVGGVPLYGDAALVSAGPSAPGCETIDLCTTSKFVCVATTSTQSKLDQTLATIKGALETALQQADALTPDGYDFAPLAPLYDCK